MKLLIIFTMLFGLSVLNVGYVHAAPSAGEDGAGIVDGEDGTSGAGSGSTDTVSLQNPLKSPSLLDFFQQVLDVIMIFAVPLIVFFIILAGFKYVMAQGNPAKIGEANKALLYAIIGGILILGAQVILSVISGTISAF